MSLTFRIALLLLVLLTAAVALGQSDDIVLEPLTDEQFMLESVVPRGWSEVTPGLYARGSATGDPSWILQQSAVVAADPLLSALLGQLRVRERPQPSGTHESERLTWTLYEPTLPDAAVAVALAEDGGRTYIVVMHASRDEYEALRASVFLPVVDALRPLVEAAPDAAELPYVAEAVTFASGDVTLAGTLTLPRGEGPHPAVILISGSGQQDRDSSLAPVAAIRPFRLIADHLSRNSIAVLRYDDRGTAQSTGDYSTASLDDFAADAAAALAFLRAHDAINPNEVGLLGHSEGGLVATMLAAREPDIAFLVTLAGPGVIGRETLIVQNERLLRAGGATDQQVADQLAFLQQAFLLLDEEDWEALEALFRETITRQFDALPEAQRQALGPDLEARIEQTIIGQLASFRSPEIVSFLNYDPAPDWERVRVPVLAVFGGKDRQVDAEQNAPEVEAALERGGNEDYTIVVYPDANHLFQAAVTGGVQEYGTLPARFLPDLLPDLTAWLQERLTIHAG